MFLQKNYHGLWGSWCSRLLQVLASKSRKTSNVHGVSSNQFTMLSIAHRTCGDMELNNNTILRQTGQIMLLLGTQGAMYTVIHDPPLVSLSSALIHKRISVAPIHKMIQTLPMRTYMPNKLQKHFKRKGGDHTSSEWFLMQLMPMESALNLQEELYYTIQC